jgi:hypothetical protein
VEEEEEEKAVGGGRQSGQRRRTATAPQCQQYVNVNDITALTSSTASGSQG